MSGNKTLPASGGQITLTAKLDPADATTQFEWPAVNGLSISANQGTAVVSFPANTSYEAVQYTITVKTGNGKTDSVVITVEASPKPVEPSTPPAESVTPDSGAQSVPTVSPEVPDADDESAE